VVRAWCRGGEGKTAIPGWTAAETKPHGGKGVGSDWWHPEDVPKQTSKAQGGPTSPGYYTNTITEQNSEGTLESFSPQSKVQKNL